MTEMDKHDHDLEAFFSAARDDAPIPSDDLIARILADAEAEQPKPASFAPGRSTAPGFWAALWAELGGWKGATGLGFAALVGVLIGYSDPTVTDTTAQMLTGSFGYEVTDLSLSASDLWGES